jgi:hypothetical protein
VEIHSGFPKKVLPKKETKKEIEVLETLRV